MTTQELFEAHTLDAEVSLRFFWLVHENLTRTLGGQS